MSVEFWVMRVLLHPGPMGRQVKIGDIATAREMVTLTGHLSTGALAVLPDECIAEPIEVFTVEEVAHEHRRKLIRDHPGSDYRVILNATV